MSRHRDLLLTYDFPPMGGGIARMMAEIARETPPGELIVSTGQLEGSAAADAALPNPVDRLRTPSRRLKTLPGLVRWGLRGVSLVRSHQVRFVWCGNIRPAAYPARWIRNRCKVPYGLIVYGGDLLELQRNYRAASRKHRLARWLVGGASTIVAISQFTRDLAAGVLEELCLEEMIPGVRVVPLGTDPERFHPGRDSGPLIAQYDLPEGRWLVTVARLVAHKGIDTSIKALALLCRQYPNLRYAVVGQGACRPTLEELARREGVADRVHFLGDVPDAMLPQAYTLAEVYVGVSRQTERDVEGFGISLLEAQASGKPVVAGRSGGIADAVREGETGVLVDPEDPSAVAQAIRELLDHPAAASAMGQAGRRAVESFYNWPRVVRDLRAISSEARSVPR